MCFGLGQDVQEKRNPQEAQDNADRQAYPSDRSGIMGDSCEWDGGHRDSLAKFLSLTDDAWLSEWTPMDWKLRGHTSSMYA